MVYMNHCSRSGRCACKCAVTFTGRNPSCLKYCFRQGERGSSKFWKLRYDTRPYLSIFKWDNLFPKCSF